MEFEHDGAASIGDEQVAELRPTRRRDPAARLTSSMIVYIVVNLLFGIPVAAAPQWFFDVVGVAPTVADDLGGLRWLGASLVAWGVSGIIVLLRPEGRSTFVTAGALQLAVGALALLYSLSVSEYPWSTWFHVMATLIMLAGAVYLGFARFTGRKVLKGV